jgi:hypothetical protein
MHHGSSQRTIRSPFLDELPRHEVEWETFGIEPRRRRGTGDGGKLPDDIEQWEVGTLVRHPMHGLGRIMSIRRGASRTHADVQFQSGPRRTWVLEFAKLTRVDYDEIGDLADSPGV